MLIHIKFWFGESKGHLYIKWIGTHAEYTEICMANKQYTTTAY